MHVTGEGVAVEAGQVKLPFTNSSGTTLLCYS